MNRSSIFGALALGVLLLALALGNPFLPAPGARRDPQPRHVVPVAMPSQPLHMRSTERPAALAAAPAGEPAPQDLPDPDRVGPCPRAGIAVVRRGVDPLDGRPTWWHPDGSMTKRVVQTVRNADDVVLGELPAFVTLRPR